MSNNWNLEHYEHVSLLRYENIVHGVAVDATIVQISSGWAVTVYHPWTGEVWSETTYPNLTRALEYAEASADRTALLPIPTDA